MLLMTFNALALPKKSTVLPVDSSAINIRKPNKATIGKYQNSPEYTYYRNVSLPTTSVWQDVVRRFFKWVNSFFYESKYGTTRSVLFYMFLGLIVGFVVLKLMGIEITTLFGKKTKSLEIPYEAFGEDINKINYKEEIEKALNTRNYRLAVRLHYLQILKELSDKNLVKWQSNKTNRSYVYEVKHTLRQSFEAITRQFDYVWYGNFTIEEQEFGAIKKDMENFKAKL